MSTIEIIENLTRKFDRKSGDTTVRMTADDMSHHRLKSSVFRDTENAK